MGTRGQPEGRRLHKIWPSTVQQPQRHSSGLRHLFISATGSFRRRNTQSAGSMNQTGQVPASIWFTHRGICRLGTSVIHRHGSPSNRSNPEINKKTKAGRPFLGIGQKRSRGSEMATVEVTFTFQKNSSTKISLSVVVIDSVGVDEIPRKEKSPCGDSSLFKIKENKTSLASAANLTTLASPRTMGAGVPSVSTKSLDGLFNLSASFTTTTYTI